MLELEDFPSYRTIEDMSSDRRDFLKQSLLAGAALAIKPSHLFSQATTTILTDMELRFYPYTLELKHTFTIATSSRTTTPTLAVISISRINSLDPADANYSEYRHKTFLRAKRFIGASESVGIRRLSELPYYRGHEL